VHNSGTLTLRWLLQVSCTTCSGCTNRLHANLEALRQSADP